MPRYDILQNISVFLICQNEFALQKQVHVREHTQDTVMIKEYLEIKHMYVLNKQGENHWSSD